MASKDPLDYETPRRPGDPPPSGHSFYASSVGVGLMLLAVWLIGRLIGFCWSLI